jgi:hypothetical protein
MDSFQSEITNTESTQATLHTVHYDRQTTVRLDNIQLPDTAMTNTRNLDWSATIAAFSECCGRAPRPIGVRAVQIPTLGILI